MLHPSLHPQHSTQDWQLYPRDFTPCIIQEEEIGQKKVIPTFNIKCWTSSRTLWGNCEQLEWHFVTFHQNWLLSRPLCFTLKLTPFKTLMFYIGIDSFQDPNHFWTHISGTDTPRQWTVSNTTQFSHFKTLIMVYYSVSISMGDYLQKISMGDYLQELSSKLSTRWILDFFMKIRRKRHHMQLVNSSQATSLVCPAFGTAAFTKTHSFQDPKNFTYTVDSNNCVQTLSHHLRHRTRTS